MNVRQAYNVWADNYDKVENKTRDLEVKVLRESIFGDKLDILELGCGTGKNTAFLQTKARHLVGADFSAEMLVKAGEKITARNVEFRHLDLREEWNFAGDSFDLITCSLALEHLEDIGFVFGQARKILRSGGLFYVGELHPFKQYQGSKARFEIGSGVFELECYVHNVSEFFAAGRDNRFECVELKEWFDGDDKAQIPRLLMMRFAAQ